METAKLIVKIETNTPEMPLLVELLLNDIVVSTITTNESTSFMQCEFDNLKETEHNFKIVVSGKNDEHTIYNGDELIKSTELCFSNFKIDYFDVTQAIYRDAVYTNDLNGYGEMHDEVFGPTVGCNGEITFTITTPLYLWLLDNMD